MSERRGAVPQREPRKPKADPDGEKRVIPQIRFQSFRELSILLPRGTVVRGNSVHVEPVVVLEQNKGPRLTRSGSANNTNAYREVHRPMLRVTPVVRMPLTEPRGRMGGGLSREALQRTRRKLVLQQQRAIHPNENGNHNNSYENSAWPNSARSRSKMIRERTTPTVYMEVGSRSKRRLPLMAVPIVFTEPGSGPAEPELRALKAEMRYLSKLRKPYLSKAKL